MSPPANSVSMRVYPHEGESPRGEEWRLLFATKRARAVKSVFDTITVSLALAVTSTLNEGVSRLHYIERLREDQDPEEGRRMRPTGDMSWLSARNLSRPVHG